MVPAAEDKRLSLILVVPCQGIGQRIIVVFHGRMDGHSCRLVDHQDVFIFINNVQGSFTGGIFSEDSVSQIQTCRWSPAARV